MDALSSSKASGIPSTQKMLATPLSVALLGFGFLDEDDAGFDDTVDAGGECPPAILLTVDHPSVDVNELWTLFTEFEGKRIQEAFAESFPVGLY